MNIAIIFAGGNGSRFSGGDNSKDIPKQFAEILGKPILIHSLEIFQNHPEIDKIYIAVQPEYIKLTNKIIKKFNISKTAAIVHGGNTSQDSVYNALIKVKEENSSDSIVLISDGVRPIIDSGVITKNIASVKEFGNAVTCTPCSETMFSSKNKKTPEKILIRENTYAAQAPQSFYLNELLEAHEIFRSKPDRYNKVLDSCTMFYILKRPTFIVIGNWGNIKVTHADDVPVVESLLKWRRANEIS